MEIKKFIKSFKGSSFPTLAETTNGLRIIKLRGTGNGAVAQVSEFIANNVAYALHWPVPEATWVTLPQNFPWTYGTDEFDDLAKRVLVLI